MQLVARCIADEIASAAPRKTLGVLEHVRLVVYSIQTEKNAFVQALKLSKADISALEAGKSSSTTLGAVKVTDAQNTFDLDFPTTWAPMVSGAYAAIGRRLRGGSEALFSERKDATENLTYCIQNPTLYLQYGENNYGEAVHRQKELQKWDGTTSVSRHRRGYSAEDLHKRIRSQLQRKECSEVRALRVLCQRHELLGA